MKSKLRSIAAFILFVLANGIKSQELLTIDNAIKLGLEKNYAVLIVKNEQEISKAQNNFGAAGMSPTVNLNGSLGTSNLNSHQEFNTGLVQDRPGAISNNLAASLNASWVIFDGLRMFAVKKRLELNEGLSAIELKQQMENTVYEIIAAYYNISRIEGLIKAAKQNLSIYEERKKIASLKLQVGSDSKVDFLLSQTDENRAKSTIIDLEVQLLTAKVKLNNLLSRPVDVDFKTSDSIVVNYNPALEDLKKSALASNASLLISKQNEMIFSQSVKEARSANLPFVSLNGAYQFSRNTSQAGIVFLNRQNGLVGGVTVSWLIFNGNRNNRLVKERSLQYLNQRYLTEQSQLKVDGDVFVNYRTFLMTRQIVDLETQNMSDSKTLQEISLERYKIGKSNLLETIETQKNLEDAQTRYFNALYTIKVAEAELLRTNGTLVK